MSNYYVYEHWCPDGDQPFYVGKGCGIRAYDKNTRSPEHILLIDELTSTGLTLKVVIVETDLSEEEAFQLEVRRIAFWRGQGAVLINRNRGNIKYNKEKKTYKKTEPINQDPMVRKAIKQAGGLSILARRLGLDRRHVYGWERIPARWVLDVEKVTGISRHELRPDVFGEP